MYQPSKFQITDLGVMHQLMRQYPLATIVTLGSDGLDANHIPLHLADEGEFGTLRGHVARANPLWRHLPGDQDTLIIFQGPDCYISPAFYPSKPIDGKVVPTWNYAVVHAHGKLQAHDDAAWVRRNLQDLTTFHEAGKAQPWKVDDAPADYIDKMVAAVVGIELVITKISGKFKMSQNQLPPARAGVLAGLQQRGDAPSLAVAQMVRAINPD